ncbi:MAG: glycosyltransferase family 9 protein [Candidatus Krumholzibacteria bacterium]|nr:glycosyltransferase family 9 protein [Candidatus Krumholzibacteria bacterium]
MSQPSGKICIIRLGSLGDLVLMVPLLSALRSGFPSKEIHLVCKEKYTGLFDGGGLIDTIIPVRRGDFREIVALRSALSRAAYETIVDAHGVIRSNLLFHTLRAPRKLQIRKDEFRKGLLIVGKTNLYRRITSQIERYAELAQRLGVEMREPYAELPVPPRAARSAEAALGRAGRGGGPLVAFAPGARWPTKRWPEERFARLIFAASARGCGTLLIGGAEDSATNAEVAGLSRSAPLNLTGALSIIESAAVLKRCGVLVTNDSAPLHLAEAVGTPVVAFFGPTVREFGYFPRLPASRALETALPCRPCSRNGKRACPYGTKECLASIEPSAALEALLEALGETRDPS